MPPPSTVLTDTTDRLRTEILQRGLAAEDACYTLPELATLTGYSVRYLLELTRLPAVHPRHLAAIGHGRSARVPVLVWRDYLRRSAGSADSDLTVVEAPSNGYTTAVTAQRQARLAPAGHRGRPARAWRK